MKKFKLISTISALIIAIGCLAVGVYAMTQLSFYSSGYVCFTAVDCQIEVDAEVIGAYDSSSNLRTDYNYANGTGVKYKASNLNNTTFANWNIGGLYSNKYEEEQSAIQIKMEVKNYSITAVKASLADVFEIGTNLKVKVFYQPTELSVKADISVDNPYIILPAKDGEAPSSCIITIEIEPNNKEYDAFTSSTDQSLKLFSFNASKYYEEEDFEYSISNGEAKITGYKSELTGELFVPQSIYNQLTATTYPVTELNASAFADVSAEDVCYYCVLPESITTIGESVFSKDLSVQTITAYGDISSLATITTDGTLFKYSSFSQQESVETSTWLGAGIYLREGSNPHYVFEVNSNGIITSYSGTDSVLEIPNTVNGVNVTGIASNLFKNNQNITSLNLGNCTSIGSYAFAGCTNLQSIEETNSLEKIGPYAFKNCTSLSSFDLSFCQCLKEISVGSFQGCSSLDQAGLPVSLQIVGDYAFAGCTGARGIYLSRDHVNLTYIGDYAFYQFGKNNIFNFDIEIPSSVNYLGNFAFEETNVYNIVNNSSYSGDNWFSIHSVQYNNRSQRTLKWQGAGNYKYMYCYRVLADDAVPSSTYGSSNLIIDGFTMDGTIYNSYTGTQSEVRVPAFSDCSSLPLSIFNDNAYIEKLIIPFTITNVTGYEFSGCTNLKEIQIESELQNTVISLYNNGYGWLYNGQTIVYEYNGAGTYVKVIEDNNYSIDNGVVSYSHYNTSSEDSTELELYVAINNLGIYNKVGSIEIIDYITAGNGVSSIILSENITEITDNNFNANYYGYQYLENIKLSKNITSIGEYAFAGTGLTAIKIYENVQQIGQSAFNGCDNLQQIEILSDFVDSDVYISDSSDYWIYELTGEVTTTWIGAGKYTRQS